MSDQLQTEVPTEKAITIAGVEFILPVKYFEGHVLNVNEARVLSQTWLENVRNNTAKHVKAGADEANETTMDEAIAAVTEYAGTYEFNAASSGGSASSLTPEQKEANKIAKEYVREKLAAKGKKFKDFATDEEKDKLAAAIQRMAESDGVVKLARKRVAAAKKDTAALAESAAEELDDL